MQINFILIINFLSKKQLKCIPNFAFNDNLTPDRALSSLYKAATSLNFAPAFSFSKASKIFDCFSQRM